MTRRLPTRAGSSAWSLKPGDTIHRTALRKLHGAPRQGQMVVGKAGGGRPAGDIMLFVDRRIRQQSTDYVGWVDHTCFHFGGGLQNRHQQMTEANRALHDHREHQQLIRLFQGSNGVVHYVGEFEVDLHDPYHAADVAPDGTREGRHQRVIVFHLRPVGEVVRDTSDRLPADVVAAASEVVATQERPPPTVADLVVDPQEVEQRKRKLVTKYAAAMKAKGYDIDRTWCQVDGETMPLIPDVVDRTRRNLVDSAGVVSRDAVRLLIGRLADFARFHDDLRWVALLPERPRHDLETLLATQDIAVVWITTDDVFEDNAGGSCS